MRGTVPPVSDETEQSIPVLFTAAEAARFLGIKPYAFYEIVKAQGLPVVRIGRGRNFRVSKEALIAYIREHEKKNPGAIQARKTKQQGESK